MPGNPALPGNYNFSLNTFKLENEAKKIPVALLRSQNPNQKLRQIGPGVSEI